MTMRRIRHPAWLPALLATLVLVIPPPAWITAETPAVPGTARRESLPVSRTPPRPDLPDIRLDSTGRLLGRVLDENRQVCPGLAVTVLRGRRIIARSRTDRRGEFRISGLPGGIYRVTAGDADEHCRLWADGTQPPAAAGRLDLSVPRVVVRGQDGAVHRFGLDGQGGLDPFEYSLLATSMISLTLSAVMLSKVNDIEDNVDRLSASD